MRLKQVSVFLENKTGRMAAVTRVLAARGINLRAFCIADTANFGILRIIVNNPEEALQALRDEGFTANFAEVIAVEVPDSPGGLATVLEHLDAGGVNIEYLYAFCEKCRDNALVIFRVEDVDAAVKALEPTGIRVVPSDEVYSM
jgi:hypothetical protein